MIEDWLKEKGFETAIEPFKQHDIDYDVISYLTEDLLKEMEISEETIPDLLSQIKDHFGPPPVSFLSPFPFPLSPFPFPFFLSALIWPIPFIPTFPAGPSGPRQGWRKKIKFKESSGNIYWRSKFPSILSYTPFNSGACSYSILFCGAGHEENDSFISHANRHGFLDETDWTAEEEDVTKKLVEREKKWQKMLKKDRNFENLKKNPEVSFIFWAEFFYFILFYFKALFIPLSLWFKSIFIFIPYFIKFRKRVFKGIPYSWRIQVWKIMTIGDLDSNKIQTYQVHPRPNLNDISPILNHVFVLVFVFLF